MKGLPEGIIAAGVLVLVTALVVALFFLPGDIRAWRQRKEARRARRLEDEEGA
jgi:uncharacterized protein HemY